MVLYFVRHGIPDYSTDTLLPEGWHQAELAAKRLKKAQITAIYSSPMGRAQQTAKPLADALHLPIQIEPWASEIGDEFKFVDDDGNRKRLSAIDNAYFFSPEFRSISCDRQFDDLPIGTPEMKARYENISEGLDSLLLRHGYRRTEDGRYFCDEAKEDHVVLFCHCGMQRVMFSHIFGIPYQYVSHTLMNTFTGITVLYFPEKQGDVVMPTLISYGDVGHLYEDADVLTHYTEKCEF